MEASLVSQGLELMLFGMGTVILFLTMLVIVTTLMSGVVQRFFPLPEDIAPVTGRSAPAGPDATTLAVITAAIHQHRSRR